MSLLNKFKLEAKLFIAVCHKLAENMYVTGYGGNLAWTLDNNLVMITPTMMNKGKIKKKDLVFIDLSGAVVEGKRKPTGEKSMYLKFFADRKDIVSVLHCHAPNVGAFAITGGKNWLMRPFFPETITEVGPVPVIPYAEPLTEQLAVNFSDYLPMYNSFIMENHGLVTMSRDDIHWTHMNVELLEMSALSIIQALSMDKKLREIDKKGVEDLWNVMVARGLPLFGAPGVNKSLVDLYYS